MDSEKILFAIQERDKWREREMELSNALISTPRGERRAKRQELERIKEQVAYYEALTRDMKKNVKPLKVSHLLNSLCKV